MCISPLTLNQLEVSQQIWTVVGLLWFFSSESVSKAKFKKSPNQVHIIPNSKWIDNFETNLGCIWIIVIFFSKLVSQL